MATTDRDWADKAWLNQDHDQTITTPVGVMDFAFFITKALGVITAIAGIATLLLSLE